ncbi:MAG: SWI/SNF complex component snf12 [Thelocarpon impressellum]|nr:MAG: SWI/SNF complex component snf12 [Thelocarpon impressellum]
MAAQYRPQHYPPQRSPHTSAVAARRAPGPMLAAGQPPPPATHPAQVQAQQAAAAQERELAKRRSRKPTDKNMPEGVEEVVIGDGVQRYKELRELERRLDAMMMRKRLDVQDAVTRHTKRYKTLRIEISNTAENQPWQAKGLDANAFDFSTGIEATYKVSIRGTLLDDDDDPDVDSDEEEDVMDVGQPKPAKVADPTARTRLSHFFKAITIDLDRPKALQPDATNVVEWKKPLGPPGTASAAAEFDVLEFVRKGDENINCTVHLVRDENPERFRLSRELADVLDADEEDRAGVVMGIWEYVRAHRLQEDEERRAIRCDEKLRAVFKSDTVFFPYIPDLILHQNHLLPLPAIRLPYTIRVDSSEERSPTVYLIRVPLPDPLRTQLSSLLASPSHSSTLRSIAALDDTLTLLIQAIAHARAKHGFQASLARDPAGFLRRWIGSQRRDLEVVLGDAVRGVGEEGGVGEEWRRGGERGVWGGEGVRESVELWLARGR